MYQLYKIIHFIHIFFVCVGLLLDFVLTSCEYHNCSVLDIDVTNPVSYRAFASLSRTLCLGKPSLLTLSRPLPSL